MVVNLLSALSAIVLCVIALRSSSMNSCGFSLIPVPDGTLHDLMAIPLGLNQRWSLDFVSDALTDVRRFRIICVVETSAGNACQPTSILRSLASGLPGNWTGLPTSEAIPAWWSATTPYVGKINPFRSAGVGASGFPATLIWLPRRVLPLRIDPFHSKYRVRVPRSARAPRARPPSVLCSLKTGPFEAGVFG